MQTEEGQHYSKRGGGERRKRVTHYRTSASQSGAIGFWCERVGDVWDENEGENFL